MSFSRIAAILIAWSAAAGMLVTTPSAQAQTVVNKIAIVDAVRVFNQIQKTKDLRKQMETEGNALETERVARQTEIRDLQQRRDLLNPDAPEYARLNKDIVDKTITFKAWVEVQQLELGRRQKMKIKEIYDNIMESVQKVAEAKGIDIVFAQQNPELPDNLEQVNVDQLRILLGQRNVLFAKQTADISEAVITQMDQDYKSGK